MSPPEEPVTSAGREVRSLPTTKKRILLFFGIAFLTLVLLLVFLAVMNNRPFPVESLKFDDAALSHGPDGAIKGFQVRVTNNSDVGAKDIRIRIDILDKNKRRIDGALLTLYDRNVPPGSTRLLYTPYVAIGGLPSNGDWSWTYTVEEARKTWILDSN